MNISDEDVLWKELLIFFMNVEPSTGYVQFLKDIPPLDFDPALVSNYLRCFRSDASKADVMDELEHHYQEMDKEGRKERLERISAIGERLYFPEDEDVDDLVWSEIEVINPCCCDVAPDAVSLGGDGIERNELWLDDECVRPRCVASGHRPMPSFVTSCTEA